MGRSIQSIRQEVRGVSERWARAAHKDAHLDGNEFAAIAMRHASDAFYGCDDPLEAVLFSMLVELRKHQGTPEHGDGGGGSVDP